ncbi:MAG: hypothetical protein IIA87_04415 [Nanoarchaeota archaeon]|nr:hypothetical protein [Nanoarchaeota archaeon]
MGLVKKIATKLPLVSLMEHVVITRDKDIMRGKGLAKAIGHSVYAAAFLAGSFIYTNRALDTGEFNWSKQSQVMDERWEEAEARRQEHKELETSLFGADGTSGLADINGDGSLSSSERADAYARMGIEPTFQTPSIEQLREGVESYEGDGK